MGTKHGVNERVQKHRNALRMSGLRPVQVWVPDTRQAGFSEECRRQSILADQEDIKDKGMQSIMDSTLSDIKGWTA